MAEELQYQFLVEFDGSLKAVGETRYKEVRFYRIGKGRYCKAYDLANDLSKLGTPVPLSDPERKQWDLPAPIELSRDQARKWIADKMSRIFEDPPAVWK